MNTDQSSTVVRAKRVRWRVPRLALLLFTEEGTSTPYLTRDLVKIPGNVTQVNCVVQVKTGGQLYKATILHLAENREDVCEFDRKYWQSRDSVDTDTDTNSKDTVSQASVIKPQPKRQADTKIGGKKKRRKKRLVKKPLHYK